MRFAITGLILLALIGGGGWYWHSMAGSSIEYKTVAIHRGDVVASISANGTVEPVEQIDVGAQVEGQIESFGKDSAGKILDNNSLVEAGMVLAKIDDTVYKADVDVAQAQLEQATTAIDKAKADKALADAKLLQAEHNWNRAQTLGPSDALSQNDYDMYQADYASAVANVKIAESEIAQANNGVPLAKAELDKAKRNLDFCTIYSPVRGTILDRRVNVGQTVVSSLNTPSLFLIAKDLSKMQVWVSVNEADMDKIVEGAPVTFTCDTFPDQEFKGTVLLKRQNASMNQNVVLYPVVVDVDNSKRVLIPFLTAKVQFEEARDTNALVVPNLALRWVPGTPGQIAPDSKSTQADAPAQPPVHGPRKQRHGTVWIKDGQFVRAIEVKLGVTDRENTAVFSDQLKDGDEIIVSDVTAGGDADQKNPFMPGARHH